MECYLHTQHGGKGVIEEERCGSLKDLLKLWSPQKETPDAQSENRMKLKTADACVFLFFFCPALKYCKWLLGAKAHC